MPTANGAPDGPFPYPPNGMQCSVQELRKYKRFCAEEESHGHEAPSFVEYVELKELRLQMANFAYLQTNIPGGNQVPLSPHNCNSSARPERGHYAVNPPVLGEHGTASAEVPDIRAVVDELAKDVRRLKRRVEESQSEYEDESEDKDNNSESGEHIRPKKRHRKTAVDDRVLIKPDVKLNSKQLATCKELKVSNLVKSQIYAIICALNYSLCRIKSTVNLKTSLG